MIDTIYDLYKRHEFTIKPMGYLLVAAYVGILAANLLLFIFAPHVFYLANTFQATLKTTILLSTSIISLGTCKMVINEINHFKEEKAKSKYLTKGLLEEADDLEDTINPYTKTNRLLKDPSIPIATIRTEIVSGNAIYTNNGIFEEIHEYKPSTTQDSITKKSHSNLTETSTIEDELSTQILESHLKPHF